MSNVLVVVARTTRESYNVAYTTSDPRRAIHTRPLAVVSKQKDYIVQFTATEACF